MFGKNLKITTKLTISTAVFLVPLAVMFYLLISVSFDSINRYKNEMKGLACLRPAVSLMQIIPQYMRISLDGSSGGKEKISENVTNQLSELNRACQKNFGWSSPRQLADNWNILLNGTEEQQLAAYEQCVKILRAFIAEIANEAGLITDPELENIYLALTATSEMPLMQERIAGLENIFRRHKNRTISEGQLDELKSYATLLVDSDFDSVQTALNAVNDARTKSGQTEIIRVFESPSKAYHDAANSLRSELTRIIAELEEKIDAAARARTRNLREPVLDLNSVSMITGASGLLNNAIYRLQNTAFDRLETLLDARLENLQGHLVRSVILSAAATLAAFVIVFFTTLGIRQSARTAGRVFKTLEKNDLSITVTARAQDELGELLVSLGAFLEKLKTAFASFNQNALMVSTAVHDLSASSKEITTTANEQSASVAEIVSTMENSKNLSEQVAVKTGEVADLAAKTQEFSQRGAELRNANQVMMQKIREQNAKII